MTFSGPDYKLAQAFSFGVALGESEFCEAEDDGLVGISEKQNVYMEAINNLRAAFEILSPDLTNQNARKAVLEASSKVGFGMFSCPSYACSLMQGNNESEIDHALFANDIENFMLS